MFAKIRIALQVVICAFVVLCVVVMGQSIVKTINTPEVPFTLTLKDLAAAEVAAKHKTQAAMEAAQ